VILSFDVTGKPAPQGSKSAHSICYQTAGFCPRCKHQHLVKVNQRESSSAVKPWREAVKQAAQFAIGRTPGFEMFAEPVQLVIGFRIARPRSHYRAGKNAHLLRGDAPARPGSAPDLSKLIRSTEDALTDAGAWKDDCLVVDLLVSEIYVKDMPGAVIKIADLNGAAA